MNNNAPAQRRVDPVAALLTASAFVLAGMFVLTLGNAAESPAHAQAAVASGGTALVSMKANVNDDIVVTLDETTGELRTFGIGLKGGRSLSQYDRYDLKELFAQAQRANRGR